MHFSSFLSRKNLLIRQIVLVEVFINFEITGSLGAFYPKKGHINPSLKVKMTKLTEKVLDLPKMNQLDNLGRFLPPSLEVHKSRSP